MKLLRVSLLCILLVFAALSVLSESMQAQTPAGEDLVPSIYLPLVSIDTAQQAAVDTDILFTYSEQARVNGASTPVSTWSRERMLAAQPLPFPLDIGEAPTIESAEFDEAPDGDLVEFPGQLPLADSAALARESYPEEWQRIEEAEALAQAAAEPAAADAVPSLPFVSYYVTNPSYGGNLLWDEYPWITMGVLFFEIPGYGDYRCSGGVAYNRVIWTTGHCIFTPGIGWHRDVQFVPAYRNGSRPFGTFYMFDMATLTPWATEGNIAYDVGMVAVRDNSGRSIGATVGYLGSAFNVMPWRLLYNAFGYPSNLGNNGRYLMSCVGDRWLRESRNGPDPVAVPCDMTFGSSGGPWLMNFYPFRSGAYNQVVGINSYGYDGQDLMYSPYFSDGASRLYSWGRTK